MVAPWIRKKRGAQAAPKKKTTRVEAPVVAAPAKKPAVVVVETPEPTVVEEVVEVTPEETEEDRVDIRSMYKWQLVEHAESLGHDVSGLTKTAILDLLEQD